MISKILVGGIALSLVSGYYCQKKEKKLYDLFESLKEIQEFDFDYIGTLGDVPLNKPLALCANFDLDHTAAQPSQYNTKRKVIHSVTKKLLPVEKKVTKQNLNDENESFDEFYNSIPNQNLPKVYLINNNQERIEIQWPGSDVREIGLFNVKPIAEKIDAQSLKSVKTETLLEKIQNFAPSKRKAEYGEIGFDAGEKYVYIGEIRQPLPTELGKIKTDLIFKPEYVLGDSKHYFLKYLDGQLIKLNQQGKACFFVAIGLTAAHLGYKTYLRHNAQKEMIDQ